MIARLATRRRWPAYAAAGWALLFAAQSFAAAIAVMAGSAFGADTFGHDIALMARRGETGFIVTLWLAGAAKTLAAALALASVTRWGQRLPKRALIAATFAGGALILLYGVANLTEHVLMSTGAIPVAHGLGKRALPWHLWLWDPYWILGGLLFLLAAIQSQYWRGSASWSRPVKCVSKSRTCFPCPKRPRHTS